MADNRAVVYAGAGRVEVLGVDYPALALGNRKLRHGAIVRVLATGVCAVDQALVRGRRARRGLVLGHELLGEVVELGRDVEFVKRGDLVSAPFNVACGRCRRCRALQTDGCLHVNPSGPGAIYGTGDDGGWPGLQAEFAALPYADWNLHRFPDRDRALARLEDLALLTDLLPTAYHAALAAGVREGSSVYLTAASPLGLACAVACRLLRAGALLVGDDQPERLEQAAKLGCEPVDLRRRATVTEQVEQVLGVPQVDAAIDCAAFGRRGHAHGPAGGQAAGLAGVVAAGGRAVVPGPCPALRYQERLAAAILDEGVRIAEATGVTIVDLAAAADAYREPAGGPARKYLLDPHGALAASSN
jgi:glutathione-independent formaldehyde dehydrogenase